MIERLPYYYRKSKIVKDFYDVVQVILDKSSSDIDIADKRMFIITTDEFTLHEKDVNLAKSDGLDSETRRARVIARLQASRVLTVEALKELVSLYEKSGADVIELYDKYAFTLDFKNRDGVPENITEIIKVIEEVKPAHLRLGLTFVSDPAEDIFVGGFIQQLKTVNLEVANG